MRIFVSYNNCDISTAERVVQGLGAALPGLGAYFAPRSNIGGAYWLPRLGEELRRSDVLLLLLGARVGPWQELEYYEALRLNRACGTPRIVPVLLGEESPGLWFLSQFHRLRVDGQRFDALIEQLRAAVEGAEAAGDRVPPWRETNPYRGLRAMGSADAAWFFGRERLTGDIIEVLRARSDRVQVLVGSSGVGKSSIVEAGVLAALRSQLWPGDLDRAWPADLRDSRSWLALSIRPGERPLKALALGFVRTWLDDPADAEAQAMKWVANFRNGSDLAALTEAARNAIVQRTATEAPTRILLHIDQGEELYARSEVGEADRFSELVAGAVGRVGIAVMISLRSDYYGSLQEDAALFAASERIDVPPLGLQEIEAVIQRPVDRLGARFETRELVPLIAEATVRESGALPLLSFMMSEAWEAMRRDETSEGVLHFPLGVVDVAGPLVRRAETFIETHPGTETTLRRLFSLRLAHVPKEGEPVRRRATRADCSPAEWRLAEELAAAEWRLLTTGSEGGVATVEVAHEILLRKWPRLTGWIDQEREFLIWKGRLEADRREWEAAPLEKKDAAVLMGLALETARRWISERSGDLPEAEAAFVRRSDEVEQTGRAEEAQRALELAVERERSRRRAIWISRITGAAALFLLAAGTWAVIERRRAEHAADTARAAQEAAEVSAASADRERRIAESSVASYFATEATALDPASQGSRTLLLGVEAVRLDLTTQTDTALRRALDRFQWQALAGHEGAVYDVALSGDGAHMASVGADGTVRLWDLEDQARPHRILHRGMEAATSVELAGSHLAAIVDKTVHVWSLEDLDATPQSFEVPGNQFSVLALSRDGTRLFTAGTDVGEVRDLTDPSRPPITVSHPVEIRAAAFGPQGQRLALAGDSEIALWNLAKPEVEPIRLTADQSDVYAIAISADGSSLATVGFEPLGFRYASVWKLEDLDSGSTVLQARIDPMDFMYVTSSMIVASDGSQLFVGSDDGTIRRWMLDEPDRNSVLFTAQDEINQIAVASLQWVAAADAGGLIHLYDQTGGGGEPRHFGGFSGSPPMAIDVSADGTALVTAVSGGRVLRHAISHPERDPQDIFRARSDVHAMAHDPTGRWLALGESEGRVVLLDLTKDTAPPKVLDVAEGIILPLVFDSSGERLLAGDDRGLLVIDPESGSAVRRETGGVRPQGMLNLDDGGFLAVMGDGRMLFWAEGATEPELRAHLGGPVLNVAFSSDGRQLALTRSNHLVDVYDVTAREAAPITLDTGFRGSTGSVFGYPVVFSPDGRWLGMMGGDATVRLWETAEWTRAPIGMSVPGILEVDLAFTKDGSHIITGGGWHSPPKLWSMPEPLVRRACGRVGRNLTEREWRSYWGEKDYARTCSDWPLPDDIVNGAAKLFFERRDPDSILKTLGEIWSAGLPNNSKPPEEVDTEHRVRMAAYLADQALANFDPVSSDQPDVPKALGYLAAAGEIRPGFTPEATGFAAGTWNRVCWNGTVWGYAEDVFWACDLAVEKATGETKAFNRDSRGVARAVTGDLAGAEADIAAFVAYFSETGEYPGQVEKRRDWLESLKKRENPISDEVLEALRSE